MCIAPLSHALKGLSITSLIYTDTDRFDLFLSSRHKLWWLHRRQLWVQRLAQGRFSVWTGGVECVDWRSQGSIYQSSLPPEPQSPPYIAEDISYVIKYLGCKGISCSKHCTKIIISGFLNVVCLFLLHYNVINSLWQPSMWYKTCSVLLLQSAEIFKKMRKRDKLKIKYILRVLQVYLRKSTICYNIITNCSEEQITANI